MADMAQRIGVVGVGRMGANMARHLRDEGYAVSAVYDVQRELAESLAGELDCQAPETLAGVTAASDVIITVVTDDAAMYQIFSESGDSLLIGAEGRVFINCATITPQVHVDVEALAESAGANSLEACMASSITQARDGTLYLMCGGREEVYQRVDPLLESLSISRRYIGSAGTAAQVKALVNMVMNINTAGLAEGLGLGSALGLDLETLQTVFSQTGANSRVLETDGEDMVIRDHETYFSSLPRSQRLGHRPVAGRRRRSGPAAGAGDEGAVRQDDRHRQGRVGQVGRCGADLPRTQLSSRPRRQIAARFLRRDYLVPIVRIAEQPADFMAAGADPAPSDRGRRGLDLAIHATFHSASREPHAAAPARRGRGDIASERLH